MGREETHLLQFPVFLPVDATESQILDLEDEGSIPQKMILRK